MEISSGLRQQNSSADGRFFPAAEKGPVHEHAVQFYNDDAFLATVVAEFLAEGLNAQQPVVLFATRQHRTAFIERLNASGIVTANAVSSGQLIIADARETLTQFMREGKPDPVRFREVVCPLLERAIRLRPSTGVRAYGEMVDLLWKDGNASAALQLEALWNDLAKSYDFALLCAYSMVNFGESAHTEHFREICGTHTRVVPAEMGDSSDAEAQQVEISLLQQRARALESEIRQRQALETQLRTALADLHIAGEERELSLERERAARDEAVRARLESERALRAAEQANRAKSEFLAVMSHELRTPLNAIGGYAELMELGVQGPISPQQRETLERIQRSQRHLLGLINQVLNYARIETGSLRYDVCDVPLDEVLRTCGALLLPQVRAKGLRYAYAGCDPEVHVRADAEKLQQILLNLLTNAVKFTDRAGEIRADVETRDGSALVRIRDTGIGIATDKLHAIFDPFIQIDANYTRTRDGVGLGLAISRDLARKMGGELTVESVHGEGSTFTLSLPLARSETS